MIKATKDKSRRLKAKLAKTIIRIKKKLDQHPELRHQQETLEKEVSASVVLNSGLCEVIKNNSELTKALAVLRRGYPDLSLSEQTLGPEFRQASEIITDQIATATLKTVLPKQRVVVALPWRSALAFAVSFKKLKINNFYHLSSKRDEKTLKTIVDFEDGSVKPNDVVIIADPMLATGNTIVDTIERMIDQGVKSGNIIINSVVAAPIGVSRIKKAYPYVKIIVGALDEKLDERGYIVPGLGDFGDKYFAKLSLTELNKITGLFKASESTKKKMSDRIKKQIVSEVLEQLMERDLKDNRIDLANRQTMVSAGLAKIAPRKIIKLDTGRIEGVANVANLIIGSLQETDRIIAIEGESGTGKTSTAEKVQAELDGERFSFGGIFRYLVHCQLQQEKDLSAVISRLSFKLDRGGLHLIDGKTNVLKKFRLELRAPELEKMVPEVAAIYQAEVIKLVAKKLTELSESADQMIIIEGRGYTLDYLPADLRVKLVADPSIRAERRWAQE